MPDGRVYVPWHRLSHRGKVEEPMMKKTRLGSKVRDTVSGFCGLAVARCEYLYKPPEIGIESIEPKENKPNVIEWVSEQRLEYYRPKKIGVVNGQPKSI